VGERRVACRVLFGIPEGKNHLEDLGLDGKVMLEWTSKQSSGRARTVRVLIWLGIGKSVGFL